MFTRISNSWALVKASAEVLRADKELIVFPIISMIGVLIVTATFAIPMILAGTFEAVTEEGGKHWASWWDFCSTWCSIASSFSPTQPW